MEVLVFLKDLHTTQFISAFSVLGSSRVTCFTILPQILTRFCAARKVISCVVLDRVARCYVFKPQIKTSVYLGRPRNGIFHLHSVYFTVICYDHVVYFVIAWSIFSVMVYCTIENLAILALEPILRSKNSQRFEKPT
jgi:hypothetical protein